ncbi:MAG: hypothetical protein ACLGIC_06045 [Acidimicrobiia bacterium]
MVAVAAVLLVVAVALGVVLVRTRSRVDEVTEDLAATARARDEADAARRGAEADAAAARRERDDALEREKRARREAADVAKRLNEEREARAAADEARAAAELAAASRDDGDVAELWALALAAVRRTWEVSVAPSPGMPSPLDGADDPLRAAIEVEVDAAREEAGATIDLEWEGDAVAPPAVALRALTIAQELVARLAKTSEQAVLRVVSDDGQVVIEVEGADAEGRSVVPDDVAAEHLVAPGRYELRP